MKVLFTKDEHLMLGFRNKFRKPGWEKDLITKHEYIIDFMLKNNIKYKVTTGDLFDKQKNWSFNQFVQNKKILEMYKEAGIEIFTIAGNHDMIDGRLSINNSPFEELIKDNLINYVNKNSIVLQENNITLEINGIDYRFFNEDYQKKDFFEEINTLNWKTDSNRLLIIHQNVTPNKERITEITYDELVKICKKNKINIVACGHYHIGYPTTIIDDIVIINNWNLWRVVRDYETQENLHTPEFVVLDIKTKEFKHFQVPHKKYTDAFDLKEIEIYKETQKEVFQFFSQIDFDLINEDENDESFLKKILNELDIDNNKKEKIFNLIINELKQFQ